jgi:hypothetical protein
MSAVTSMYDVPMVYAGPLMLSDVTSMSSVPVLAAVPSMLSDVTSMYYVPSMSSEKDKILKYCVSCVLTIDIKGWRLVTGMVVLLFSLVVYYQQYAS